MRLRIGQLAKKLNKTNQTIWNYMRKGTLRSHTDISGGNHYFNWHEVCEDLNIQDKELKNKITIAYARVSTKGQSKELEYQHKMLEQYCSSKGYKFIILDDIASGLNYKRKNLKKMLDMIYNDDVERVIVTYRDRLCRFGFEIFDDIFSKQGISLEIINDSDIIKTYEQELVDDVLSIITVYSAKLYGLRSHKNKKIIDENEKLWKQKDSI